MAVVKTSVLRGMGLFDDSRSRAGFSGLEFSQRVRKRFRSLFTSIDSGGPRNGVMGLSPPLDNELYGEGILERVPLS